MTIDYSKYAPEFEVYINDKKDEILRKSITSIKITEDLEAASTFEFIINDKFNVDKEEFTWFDNKLLQPEENQISIKMGYVDYMVKLVSIGTIETITTTGFTQTSNPSMTVSGSDTIKKLLNEHPNSEDKTTNKKIKGSEIISLFKSKCQSKYKITLDEKIDKTKELPAYVTKNSLNTYGDILAEQAKRIGWTYFITRDEIHYVNPRKKIKPSMVFEWGKNLLQFVPRINTSAISSGVKVRSSSPTSNQSIEVEIAAGDEGTWDENGMTASQIAEKMGRQMRDEEILCSDREEAEIRGQALLNIQSDDLLTGNCKIIGTPDLQLGQMIQLKGVGNRFNGDYFVTNVTNQISSSGYLTDFSIRKNSIKQ